MCIAINSQDKEGKVVPIKDKGKVNPLQARCGPEGG